MTKILMTAGLAASFLLAAPVTDRAVAQQPDAQTILEDMAKAHGGREAWLAAPAIRLSLVMHLSSLGPNEERTWSDSWRYYVTTIDPDTSRTYVDVPHEGLDGFEAGFDGKQLWQTSYSFDPSFQDGAMMLSWYHYGMIALPFLAAAEGSDARYLGTESLAGDDVAYHVVQVSYGAVDWDGDFDLFIDQATGRLKAWRQGAMTPPLPGDPLPGLPVPPAKILRVVDEYQTVSGFILPRTYVSYSPAGDLGGVHMVLDAQVIASFEEAAASPPDGARVVFEKP